jgi:rhodanese-related sulfurtransferase
MVAEQTKFRRRLGTVLNVSIVILLLTLSTILTKTYIFPTEPKVITYGDKISLSDVPLERGKQSVLLFLRSDCVYCTKSGGFYKDISQTLAQTGNTHLLAVFSKNDERSTDYMSEIGLANLVSIHASFKELGIVATPTMVLIDDMGQVQEVWRGKLSPKREGEFKEKLGIPFDDWYLEESDLNDLKKNGQKVTIVDIQNRDSYARNHHPDAENIPLDELLIRGINELSLTDIVVVYGVSEADGEQAQEILAKAGFVKVYILDYKFQTPPSTSALPKN